MALVLDHSLFIVGYLFLTLPLRKGKKGEKKFR